MAGREASIAVEPSLASEIFVWSELTEDERAPWYPIVIALVKALREPTEGMLAAGEEAESLSWSSELGEGRDWSPVESIFTSMIDHLLDETE